MSRVSAGLLLYRLRGAEPEVLLVHPGGPFWSRKDAGAWSIPKGEPHAGEALLHAARREFAEETGIHVDGEAQTLAPVWQAGGKRVHAFAVRGDCDPSAIRSNTFEMEWPPRSGQRRSFPEVDRAAWFGLEAAQAKINPAQVALLDQLRELINAARDEG